MLSTIETLGTWQAVASAPACTPAWPNSCLAEPAAEENSIPGLVSFMKKLLPDLLPVPPNFGHWGRQEMGMGHPRCWGKALKPRVAAEGQHDLLCSGAFS